jgi:hypothetical protein
MCTVCVASDIAFSTPSGILAAQRKHVTAMAAPVGSDVGNRLKAMGDPMVNLVFVLLNICVNMRANRDARFGRTPVPVFDIHLVTTFS